MNLIEHNCRDNRDNMLHYRDIGIFIIAQPYSIVSSITVCTVGYVCLFCGDQIFVYFISFLSMIIYEILYT